MTVQNLQVRLASRPDGTPTAANFSFTEGPAPEPRDGQVLLRTRYLRSAPDAFIGLLHGQNFGKLLVRVD